MEGSPSKKNKQTTKNTGEEAEIPLFYAKSPKERKASKQVIDNMRKFNLDPEQPSELRPPRIPLLPAPGPLAGHSSRSVGDFPTWTPRSSAPGKTIGVVFCSALMRTSPACLNQCLHALHLISSHSHPSHFFFKPLQETSPKYKRSIDP